MLDKRNSQLPEVQMPQPPKTDWFSRNHLWGYAFLIFAFLLTITLIYQMEYGKKVRRSQFCIQMVQKAKNPQTGEVKEFPTPCDVPQGWHPVVELVPESKLSPETVIYRNSKHGFEFAHPSSLTVYTSIDESNRRLIPAGSQSDRMTIVAHEDLVFCCEAVGVSFSVVKNSNASEYAQGIDMGMVEGKEDIAIGRYKGIQLNGCGCQSFPYKLVLLNKGNDLLVIEIDSQEQILLDVFNSFKFIE